MIAGLNDLEEAAQLLVKSGNKSGVAKGDANRRKAVSALIDKIGNKITGARRMLHLSPAAGAPAFKRCAACQAVAYCTRECQKAHWKKAHKRECATLAGAAGGAAANAPSA
jgi:hypothetical protein